MCSSTGRVWFLTDRRIKDDYPQQEILRALKAKCCDEDLEFRYVLMDEVVLTVEQGNLGCLRQINRQAIPAMRKTTNSSKTKRPQVMKLPEAFKTT